MQELPHATATCCFVWEKRRFGFVLLCGFCSCSDPSFHPWDFGGLWCLFGRGPGHHGGASQRLRETTACQDLVVSTEEGGSNVSPEGRGAWPGEAAGSQHLLPAVPDCTHCSLQPSQAPVYVSPNLALERAELSPSPRAAGGTGHPCGCRSAPAPLPLPWREVLHPSSPSTLQPVLTGGFMPP